MPTRFAQRVWLSLVTRAVAIHVANAVDSLNRRHHTDVFNAQVLVWPDEENADWLTRFPGAREEVLERRRRLMLNVFGADRAAARNMLDRMFMPNFELATKLRARFDPEYCAGGLRYDVTSDLVEAELLRDRRLKRRMAQFVARSKTALHAFDSFLAKAHASLLEPECAEQLRSVRIAFHADREGLKGRFLVAIQRSASNTVLRQIADELVAIATQETECYSRRLVSLRQHHELTRLERLGYYRLVDALWPPEQG
jgi:hypothetical protein